MTNKQHSSVLVGIMIAIFCLALIVAFKPEPITGAAVRVKYYGVADEPVIEESGKIQIYVKLSKETIRNLISDRLGEDVKVAKDIIEASDFSYGLKEIYSKFPPTILADDLSALDKAAESFEQSFLQDTKCLENAGLMDNRADTAEFTIVIGLEYSYCGDDYYKEENPEYEWMNARAVSTFYNSEERKLCTQKSFPLFVVNKATGELSEKVGGCSEDAGKFTSP